MVVAASITTVASVLGIPMSLALSTVMCIVGLGWGRSTRPTGAVDLVKGNIKGEISVNAVTAETGDEVQPAGQESPKNLEDVQQLFDPPPSFGPSRSGLLALYRYRTLLHGVRSPSNCRSRLTPEKVGHAEDVADEQRETDEGQHRDTRLQRDHAGLRHEVAPQRVDDAPADGPRTDEAERRQQRCRRRFRYRARADRPVRLRVECLRIGFVGIVVRILVVRVLVVASRGLRVLGILRVVAIGRVPRCSRRVSRRPTVRRLPRPSHPRFPQQLPRPSHPRFPQRFR